MNFVDAIKSGFKNCFKYSGRASRSEYWYFYLFTLLVDIPLQLLGTIDLEFVQVLTLIGAIIVVVPFIALQVRRYHDVGLSGKWFLLIIAICFGIWIGALWLVEANNAEFNFYILAGVVSILCLIINFGISCKRSTAEGNKYGPNPLVVSREKIKKVYQETKPELVADDPIKSYTSQTISTKNKALRGNKSQATATSSEASVSENKSNLEIKLAEIEDMHERSVITKNERDRLREKSIRIRLSNSPISVIILYLIRDRLRLELRLSLIWEAIRITSKESDGTFKVVWTFFHRPSVRQYHGFS